MEEAIVIRECTEGDIDAVLALRAGSAAPHTKPDTTAGGTLRLMRDSELFVPPMDGERLVGSLMGGWDGWRGTLYRMAVAPDYRRPGILIARAIA